MKKKWYKSKTLWFNGLSGTITVAGVLAEHAGVLNLPPMVAAYLMIFVTTGNQVLRLVTKAGLEM